jgi:hypothetical protein
MDLRNGFLQVYNSEGVSGSFAVTGSSTLSGSLNVFGSASVGATITGSLTISGSSRVIGSQIVTGSLITSGSLSITGTGSVTLQGTLFITGSQSTSGSINVNSGNVNVTSGSVIITRSGSNSPSDALFDVEGAQGQLFSVIDTFSGSLMSVNDISGFPILDVRSDDTITMGTFGSNALVVSGSAVIIGVTASAAPTVTGSNGQIQFAVVGGTAFIYAWLGGRWRSGSLA